MPGLYVHIPFCKKKCNYCGFYSVEYDDALVDAFIDALKREAEIKRLTYPLPHAFNTVYIGGGTPSVLSSKLLGLIEFLTDFFVIEDGAEFTVELNPESTHEELLKDLLASGINRLSFGVQTLNDRDLRTLGRLHRAKEAIISIEKAYALGFKNISADLIYGYPGHKSTTWEDTLKRLLDLPVTHLSCYEFELERGSIIERQIKEGKLRPLQENIIIKLMDIRDSVLSEYGFTQYEISNFTKGGYECLHNINYWLNGEYLGLGPSGATYLGGIREKNISDIKKYIKCIKENEISLDYRENLSDEMKFRESIVLALRMTRGVVVERFLVRFGINPIDFYRKELESLKLEGLIELSHEGFSLTKRGLRLANYVMQKLI